MMAHRTNLKKLSRRGLSLLMALIMMVGMIQISAFAVSPEAEAPAKTWGVKNEWVDPTDASKTLDSSKNEDKTDKVTVEKTATALEAENEFEINLIVTTKEDIEKLSISPNAAVVLVVDTSGSMKTDGRLESVKDVLNDEGGFLDAFADVGDTAGAKRFVALVDFSSGADAKKLNSDNYWVNVTNSDTLKKVKGTVDGLNAEGGTNIEGGLLVARNLLTDEKLSAPIAGIEKRYVILLTDGVPTYHVNGTTTDTSKTHYGADGSGGSTADYDDYKDISTIANDIKDVATLWTVAYGKVSDKKLYTETVLDPNGTSTKGYFDDEDNFHKCPGKRQCDNYWGVFHLCTEHKVTTRDVSVGTWLTSIVGKENLYKPENAGALQNDFKAILTTITNLAKAWKVTDPMGDFITYTPNSASSKNVSYNEQTKTLTWDMKNESPNQEGDVYTYELTYTIKLDTDGTGFDYDEDYPTNGRTTLDYVVAKDGNIVGKPLKTIDFPVPVVWGTQPEPEPVATSYTIIHKYYTGENLDGSSKLANKSGFVGETLDFSSIVKNNHGVNTYELVETIGNPTLQADSSENIITLVYKRDDGGGDDPVTTTYTVIHEYYTDAQDTERDSYSEQTGLVGVVDDVITISKIVKEQLYGYKYMSCKPESITLVLEPNEDENTITLRYELNDGGDEPGPDPDPEEKPSPEPDYYTVTVNYFNEDGGDELINSYESSRIREGRTYNVNSQKLDSITVDGIVYDFTSMDGDDLDGYMSRDRVIDLYYAVDTSTIPEPDVPGIGTPTEPTDPVEPTEPTEPTAPVEVPDTDTPTTAVPETGDNMMLWVLATMASGLGLIWMGLSEKKQKKNGTF